MMNLCVQDLLSNFEYEVKQGHYKKMDYWTWRSLNAQRSSPVEIKISKDLNSTDAWPEAEITLMVGGTDYSFDAWDRSFGEFLSEFMQIELNSKSLDALSAATASVSNAIKSSCNALNEFKNKCTCAYTYDPNDWNTVTSITTNFYEKQPTVEIGEKGLKVKGQYVEEIIDEATGNSIQIRKEKEDMDLIKNFDFGSCANDRVKVSMYGIAVQNAAGTWVSYDAATGNVIDVDIFNFDGKYLYKMPVAIKDIKAGDTIIHGRKPMYVVKVEDGKVLAIDPASAEEKVVLPVRNMFGFDFVTKIVNLFDNMFDNFTPSAEQPFGNPLMLMMLANDKSDISDLLPFAFMSLQNSTVNPLMFLMLADKTKSDNLLPLMFLNQSFGQTK